MTDTTNYTERGLQILRNQALSVKALAYDTVSPNKVLSMTAAGKLTHCENDDTSIVGVSGDIGAAASYELEAYIGPCIIAADAPVDGGQSLKAGHDGAVVPLVDSALAGTTIFTAAVGSAFGNQPANDAVTIVSSSASDTQTATVIGTTNGTDTVVTEDIVLTGTTPVTTAKTDWGVILAFKLDSAAVGTITFKEDSGGATITTITAGNSDKGVQSVADYAYNVAPVIVAGGASTKQVGMYGTDSTGASQYDSQALNGTTDVTMNSAFLYIDELYTGDVGGSTVVTVSVGAQENSDLKIGKALEQQATVGDLFLAFIIP